MFYLQRVWTSFATKPLVMICVSFSIVASFSRFCCSSTTTRSHIAFNKSAVPLVFLFGASQSLFSSIDLNSNEMFCLKAAIKSCWNTTTTMRTGHCAGKITESTYIQMSTHFELHMCIDFVLCVSLECASTLSERALNSSYSFAERTLQYMRIHIKRRNTNLASKGRIRAWFSHILDFTFCKIIRKKIVLGQRFIVNRTAIVFVPANETWTINSPWNDEPVVNLLKPWRNTFFAESMTTRC